jgi:hypothetical protein
MPWKARIVLLLLIANASAAFAGSATWDLDPADGNWNTAMRSLTFNSDGFFNVGLTRNLVAGELVASGVGIRIRKAENSGNILRLAPAGCTLNRDYLVDEVSALC